MSKKKPASRKSRKPSKRERTPDDIIDLWITAAKGGLGKKKKFAAEIVEKYSVALKKKIEENLTAGAVFDGKAETNTKQVAHDIGLVCKLLTLKAEVTKDTFDAVFDLMKDHPLCPAPGSSGAGGWCDIPIP